MSILAGLKIISDLSESDIQNLEMFCQEKFLKAEEELCSEGDDATAMYILKSGKLEVSKVIKNESVVLGEVEAEEIIGEMALFNANSKRMGTVVAVEDSELITILSFSIKELANKNPDLMEKIIKIINERRDENKKLEESIRS